MSQREREREREGEKEGMFFVESVSPHNEIPNTLTLTHPRKSEG